MPEFYDLQIHINGEQKFFLNEIVSKYSARLKKMIDQEKRRTKTKKLGIEIDDFPGGANGFELVCRFCYNNGKISITVSNVSLFYCCAVFLGMTEKVSTCNLLQQTETFLAGMFYWSWIDILVCLKSCFPIFAHADSSGLVQKLISALLVKIAQNSDTNFITSSSSSSSSPETASGYRFYSSSKSTPDLIKSSSSSKAWWFEDLAVLPPNIIEKVIQSLGAYGPDNNSLILTRFLLHYLKTAAQSKAINQLYSKCEYGGLADTAIHGVVTVGKEAFSCRGLLWVLRIVSGFGLNKDYKVGLEKLIGGMLDQATLDDLLVSGHDRAVYDVNLVLRLIRAFVNSDEISIHKMKKVGRLIDKYLGEISPDQNLKISKFLGVAESLPDSARDCLDGVYRAIDIYIQSHVSLSIEERSRLCGCLNYEKLSLAVCKELAKNPRIPPRIAVQALISQQSKVPKELDYYNNLSTSSTTQMVLYNDAENFLEENEDMRQNLTRMQWRVVELEKECREMKGHMSKLVRHNVMTIPSHNRTLPRLC
ncbi:BTB/POZ domain-containing protein At3g19850 isoform X2 [Quercus robur]|uniref:BTB/POZ domain-containing protein At3g19850 isoform X2 n=1 Tax=Quercus robur TaxID=38942 RepID=UPI0021630C57|nr:BTB/POZ domain-containing protein At3g19850 isoform X2 [Quercus robur]